MHFDPETNMIHITDEERVAVGAHPSLGNIISMEFAHTLLNMAKQHQEARAGRVSKEILGRMVLQLEPYTAEGIAKDANVYLQELK